LLAIVSIKTQDMSLSLSALSSVLSSSLDLKLYEIQHDALIMF